ncbi:hypothetical protein MPSEU_000175500 [Mayamaea pseudoterrestris]|nr:hypothetical protein MPSEU_000175500 [Mayamaea pseudoterrestris]
MNRQVTLLLYCCSVLSCQSVLSIPQIQRIDDAAAARRLGSIVGSISRSDPSSPFASTENDTNVAVIATRIVLEGDADDAAGSQPIQQDDPTDAIYEELQEQARLKRQQRRDTTFIVMLAALCGSMDGLFMHHYQVYANMMTGNVMKFAAALANAQWNDACKFSSMIAFYTVGCSIWRVIRDGKETTVNKDLQSAVAAATRAPSSDDKTQKLRRIVPTTFTLFALADVLSHADSRLFLPIMATAFGLVNTATVECIGVVTNAATGHVSKIGVGLGGYLIVGAHGNVPSQNVGYLATFATSMLLTTKLYQWTIHSNNVLPWMRLQKMLPPLGSTLGLLYAGALLWYTKPAKAMPDDRVYR